MMGYRNRMASGFAAAAGALAVTGVASAALTATESFEYAPGTNVEGQTGGSGWAGGWSVDADGAFTATTPGLSYPGITPAGGAAEILPGSATSTYFRNLASTLTTGDTFYVGFVAEKTVASDDTRYFGVGLFLNSNEKTLIGQGSGFANWTVTGLGAVYGLPSNVASSTTSSQDQSYLLARVDLRAGVETITLWVNPDFSKSELENAPVGSYVTNVDWDSVNRIRLGGGGTSGAQVASAHLFDELLVTTSTPFTPGNVRLFYDDGEHTAAGSTAAQPLFGSNSPKPYNQRVLATGSGAATPGGNVVPATSATGGTSNVMAIDRDSGDIGRRNYGEFVEPATGEGVVRVEVDIFVKDGQIQFGLGSNQNGNTLDNVKLSLGLSLNANGNIQPYGSSTVIAAYDVGQWEHFVLEYELGASVFSFTVNGVTTSVDLPALGTPTPTMVPLTEMHRVWLAAGTSTTTGFYDNVDVQLIVPEPASLALLALGGVAIASRRRGA